MPHISNRRDYERYGVEDIHLTARSRYRRRADGGTDTTYRINFRGALTPDEMRRITEALLQTVDEGAEFGITALTKVEFLEPDTCDVRYWVGGHHSDVLNVFFGLWYRLHAIHTVSDVDGVRYSFFSASADGDTQSENSGRHESGEAWG
jgi:hypothetical protein